jgi:DNA-binding transcriptional LysR family regulator
MKITLRQIRAFAAVAETQGFTTAAERLNLTQSAVSMLVRQLEEILGLELFIRTGHGVMLTEFGDQARPVFARVMADLEGVQDAAQGLRALSRGTLRLALTQVLAATWLPGVLDRFSRDHPGVALEIADITGDRIVQAIARDEAEIGIGPARSHGPEMVSIPLWRVPIRLVTPRGQGTGQEGRQWIHYSDEFRVLLEQAHQLHEEGGSAIRVRSLFPALAMIGRGRYVTAAPSYAAGFAEQFDIAFHDFPDPAVTQEFMIYLRRDHALSPAARAFQEIAVSAPPMGATRLEVTR